MFVKLYRYRPAKGVGILSLVGPEPYVQRVSLRSRSEPWTELVLDWWPTRETYEAAAREWCEAQLPEEHVVLGPNLVLPRGTVLESDEEFEDSGAAFLALAQPEPLAGAHVATASLATALARRLAPHAPDALRADFLAAWLAGEMAWALEHEELHLGINRAIEEAAESALEHFQNAVAEVTGEPFPARAPDSPRAGASVVGKHLRLWFGAADSPALELEPVTLEELPLVALERAIRAPKLTRDELERLAFSNVADAPPELEPLSTYAELVAVILADVMYGYEWPEEFIDPSYDAGRIAHLLGLEPELSDALLVALRFVDQQQRVDIVQRFYSKRGKRRVPSRADNEVPTFDDQAVALRLAAFAALTVLDLTRNPDLDTPVIRDLLQGAAQGDEPPARIEPWIEAVAAVTTARAQHEDEYFDELAAAAATTALREVFDPRHGDVSLREVVVSAVRAVAASDDYDRLVDFLLELDRRFAAAQPR